MPIENVPPFDATAKKLKKQKYVVRDGARMTKAEARDIAKRFFKDGGATAAEGILLEKSKASEWDQTSANYIDFEAGYNSRFCQREWEVALTGNPQDLYLLTQSAGTPDHFRIWGGTDHWHDCPNERYSFNSIYFENEHDLDVIWQVAHELVSLFNGASELFTKGYWKQKVESINFCGRTIDWRPRAGVMGLLGRPGIKLLKYLQTLETSFLTCRRLGLVVLATERQDVYMILKYLDLEGNWSNYYKLMETVDSHAALRGIDVPDDLSKRKRFTNTANNFSIAGFDSRHGFKQLVKENKTPAMTLDEAHEYVTGLCKSYLVIVYKDFAYSMHNGLPPRRSLAETEAMPGQLS